MIVLNYEKFLKEKKAVLIDVRSPIEFKEEPIPGAKSIPLFTNEERAIIGTAYVQESPEQAKRLGMDFMAKRLPSLFEEINELSKEYKRIVFFCAKGGMRSSSVVSLFGSLGYRVAKLDGGYKSYRKHITKEIPLLNEGIKYLVVHGRTGIGKTKVLQGLEKKGYQVLDLEKHADHKGSFYGALCESRKQSQKRFESELAEQLRNREENYFIVESESKRIGDLYIPESIFAGMGEGHHIFLETTMEFRVNNIMEDYWEAPIEEMLACTNKLRRYLKEEDVIEYEKMLNEKRFAEFSSSIMENYYDPLYQKSIKKYDFPETIFYEDLETAVNGVIDVVKKFELEENEETETKEN